MTINSAAHACFLRILFFKPAMTRAQSAPMQSQGGQGQVGGLGMTMAQDNINAQAQHFMQQSMSVGGSRTGYGNGQQGILNAIPVVILKSF